MLLFGDGPGMTVRYRAFDHREVTHVQQEYVSADPLKPWRLVSS